MQTYLKIDEFCKLVHLKREIVEDMISRGALNCKNENGEIFIEASEGTMSVVPTAKNEILAGEIVQNSEILPGETFVEKTIGTILTLHEKVLDAKDETLEVLRNENKFLKDALYSMQELYEEDRKIIETLTAQLKTANDEIEFLKRKYKLMWNKAVENYKPN